MVGFPAVMGAYLREEMSAKGIYAILSGGDLSLTRKGQLAYSAAQRDKR